jgi:hypothetical protein
MSGLKYHNRITESSPIGENDYNACKEPRQLYISFSLANIHSPDTCVCWRMHCYQNYLRISLGPGSSARASRLRILITNVKASIQAFNHPGASLPRMPMPRVVQVQLGCNIPPFQDWKDGLINNT